MTEPIKAKISQMSIDGDFALIGLNKKQRRRLCEALYMSMKDNLERLNPYFTDYVERFQENINEDLDILMRMGLIRADIMKRAQETYEKNATQEKEKENTTPPKE